MNTSVVHEYFSWFDFLWVLCNKTPCKWTSWNVLVIDYPVVVENPILCEKLSPNTASPPLQKAQEFLYKQELYAWLLHQR